MRILRILLAIPIIAVLVIFALSNREAVTLSFLGYDLGTSLSVAILIAAAVAFLLGALFMWAGELRQRRRARRAEARVAQLEAEIGRLAPLPVPVATASGAPLPIAAPIAPGATARP